MLNVFIISTLKHGQSNSSLVTRDQSFASASDIPGLLILTELELPH